MKLITRDTDYAILAIMYIAQFKGEIVSVAQVQQELNLPKPFLRKILQLLQKAGILNSTKGNKGGFNLAQSPKDISLATLMKVFQGKMTLTECLQKKKTCQNIKQCFVRKKIKDIEKKLISELKSITIASLINKQVSSL